MYHIIFALALAFWLYVRLSGGTISYFIPIAVLVYYGLMLCYYYASVNLFMKRSRELVYMIQKSGFTLGTADGFLDFLREKGLYKKR